MNHFTLQFVEGNEDEILGKPLRSDYILRVCRIGV